MAQGRPRTGSRNALLALLSFGLLLNFVINPSLASTPANKAVASGQKVVVAAPGENVTLMTAKFKTAAPEDAILNVSLECTILTALITNNDNNSATATSTITVWVEIDGKVVPINDVSSPGDHTPGIGNDTDRVVFCNREYSRTVTDTEDPEDGIDQIDDYISTKSSHSFQWLVMNLGSATHTITVKANLVTNTVGQAQATAVVGNRTLIVEPTKLANDASF